MDKNINATKEDMNIVIVGHVDHGKSTIIGRLLADTNSLPDGKLEQVKETCRRNSKPFEYAFLLDALKDEQAQGITIDAARVFFSTTNRNYIIIDAPGHVEFLKNMITGASRAESALLVIDAAEGVRENSKRHGYMLSMLGIKQITIVVNKMDLVDYSEDIFNSIQKEYKKFLSQINMNVEKFIPVSGFFGDNILNNSEKMKWYEGETILDTLDNFKKEELPVDKPFRMPVQDVYKFTKDGDNRRIVTGTITSGKVKVGDEVVFYPSGKRSRVKSLEKFNTEIPDYFSANDACGFTLEEQIFIKRGELAFIESGLVPKVTSRFKVNLFWLSREPMVKDKQYFIKIGTDKVVVEIEDVLKVLDASSLDTLKKDNVDRHDVAECILKTKMPISFDLIHDIQETSRFVIVDNYEIAGGGIITEQLEDDFSSTRNSVLLRESKWEKSDVSLLEKAEKYNQKSALILITGSKDTGKKPLAKALEKKLFNDGKFVYYLGIGSVKYGLDADIILRDDKGVREEHLRRLGEVANILLDTGTILIVTAINLTEYEKENIKAITETDNIITVCVGANIETDIEYDLYITEDKEEGVNVIKEYLQEKNIIFRP